VSLIGDDWDPQAVEMLTAADGLRDLVAAVREDRARAGDLEHDLHLLDVSEAADGTATRESSMQPVTSGFGAIEVPASPIAAGHGYDRSRPVDEQR
jgi:hypothetical protein